MVFSIYCGRLSLHGVQYLLWPPVTAWCSVFTVAACHCMVFSIYCGRLSLHGVQYLLWPPVTAWCSVFTVAACHCMVFSIFTSFPIFLHSREMYSERKREQLNKQNLLSIKFNHTGKNWLDFTYRHCFKYNSVCISRYKSLGQDIFKWVIFRFGPPAVL